MRKYLITLNHGGREIISADCREERNGLHLVLTEDCAVGQFVYISLVKDIEEILPDPIGPLPEDDEI